MESSAAYPLHWPGGYDRTKFPKQSPFAISLARARDSVIHEVRLLRGRGLVISTNIELRLDGLPYANRNQPEDTGVAVYFELRSDRVALCCDKWKRVAGNMQAVAKTIEAMRGMDRWGVSDMLNRMFTGFQALPENASQASCWDILGIDPTDDSDQIRSAYRIKAKETHPDHGGSTEQFVLVQQALSDADRILRSKQ